MDILVGTNDLESGGIYYKPKTYIQHEDYGRIISRYANDIAVIRLEQSIEFNEKIQPIEYSVEEVPPGSVVTLTGWGRLHVSFR